MSPPVTKIIIFGYSGLCFAKKISKLEKRATCILLVNLFSNIGAVNRMRTLFFEWHAMCGKCEVCIVGGEGKGGGGIGGWIQRKLSSFQSFVKSQGTTERGHQGVCVPFKYQNALSVQHQYDRECFSCWSNITSNLKSVDLNDHLAKASFKTNALSTGQKKYDDKHSPNQTFHLIQNLELKKSA